MNSLLNEFSVDNSYMMLPSAYAAFRSKIFQSLESGKDADFEADKRLCSVAKFVSGQMNESSAKLTDFHAYNDDEDFDDPNVNSLSEVKYINIMNLTGMITRGDGYSYGSLVMRDYLMRAAYRDDVIAHVLYCRTPGGASDALLDFAKAFEYIRSRGQKVYMYCDGMVASLGVVIGSMCDGVYAFNENDEIGSIGLYKAFLVLPSGSVNAITQEKYVEVYADKSTEKNREPRAAGNDEIDFLKESANKDLEEVLTQMRIDRPSIKEEQMNGAMFKMKDVVGTIIDGICTLPELCERIYGEWADTQSASTRTQAEDNNQSNINQQTNPAMSKEYKNLASLAGYEAEATMVSDNEGLLTLQPQEADAMEERLQAMTEQSATLEAENTSLKEGNNAMSTALANMAVERDAALREVRELKETLAKNDDTQIQEVRSEMQAQLDEASARYVALEDAKKNLETSLAEVTTEKNNIEANAKAAAEEAERLLAEKEQIITDLQAQLAEANSGSGSKVNAGESPKTNGDTAGASQMTSAPAWDSSKSAAENVKAMDDYMKRQKNSVK